jgi:hypothetical protein
MGLPLPQRERAPPSPRPFSPTAVPLAVHRDLAAAVGIAVIWISEFLRVDRPVHYQTFAMREDAGVGRAAQPSQPGEPATTTAKTSAKTTAKTSAKTTVKTTVKNAQPAKPAKANPGKVRKQACTSAPAPDEVKVAVTTTRGRDASSRNWSLLLKGKPRKPANAI